MSFTTFATDAILAELKEIKAMLSKGGFNNDSKVPAPPAAPRVQPQAPGSIALAPAPAHAPPTPKEKLIQLITDKKPVSALELLADYSAADLVVWGYLPADLLLRSSDLLFRCLRLGLVNLETTSTDNLQLIFDREAKPEDRQWLVQKGVSPAVAIRMRELKRNRNAIPVHLVMWLYAKPACIERLKFVWELHDTQGVPVFPAGMGFWNNLDCFMNGDLMNPDFVEFWAKNVLVYKQLRSIAN